MPTKLPKNLRAKSSSASTRIPTRWKWHYQKLSYLHDRLLQDRAKRLSEISQPAEPTSREPAESGTDEFDHELALCLLSSEQDALYEVEAAMSRTLHGGYGICEQTKKPIPSSRLKVIPWTRFRKEVADHLERERVTLPTRLGAIGTLRTNSR